MEDLLTTVLCEAGLDEFVTHNPPAPATTTHNTSMLEAKASSPLSTTLTDCDQELQHSPPPLQTNHEWPDVVQCRTSTVKSRTHTSGSAVNDELSYENDYRLLKPIDTERVAKNTVNFSGVAPLNRSVGLTRKRYRIAEPTASTSKIEGIRRSSYIQQATESVSQQTTSISHKLLPSTQPPPLAKNKSQQLIVLRRSSLNGRNDRGVSSMLRDVSATESHLNNAALSFNYKFLTSSNTNYNNKQRIFRPSNDQDTPMHYDDAEPLSSVHLKRPDSSDYHEFRSHLSVHCETGHLYTRMPSPPRYSCLSPKSVYVKECERFKNVATSKQLIKFSSIHGNLDLKTAAMLPKIKTSSSFQPPYRRPTYFSPAAGTARNNRQLIMKAGVRNTLISSTNADLCGFTDHDTSLMRQDLMLTRERGYADAKLTLANFDTIEVSRKDSIRNERKIAKDAMKSAISSNRFGLNSNIEVNEEEENLGYAETYSDYRPMKLRSGLKHPDCVVETASLSSVAPPDVKYSLSIPEEIIDTGAISAVQLEAVLYACQTHESRLPSGERAGYLIGDGAGVGKGRTIACIIYENYILGRKRSLWLSVSSDLKFDSERDLRDIGAGNIEVHALNKFKYAKISGKENGHVKRGCIFATYSSLIGECRDAKSKYRTRLKQLIQWCGHDFDGVIVLDECHRAKNLVPTAGTKPTKTGRVVMDLQRALPNARIVYASATGATEPKNMAYMTRLGLWGNGQAFREFSDFINSVEKRGVGAMEIVAMDMKQRGVYLARQLSFHDVKFTVEEVALTPEFIEMYDESVKIWMECKRQFEKALACCFQEERGQSKQIWGQFWAAHQRFFKYLCISAKVNACVEIARNAVRSNKCVVIGLQSTGESKTLEVLEDVGELTDFVSTAKAVLTGLIDKHFPTDSSCYKRGGDPFADFDKFFKEKRKTLKRIEALEKSPSLPTNPPEAKRAKRSSESSNDSQKILGERKSGRSDEDSSSLSNAEDDAESDNGLIDGDEDAWMKQLMKQAKSSDEENSDSSDSSDADSDKDTEEVCCTQKSDDEINPFVCDFTQEDPWANKQQVISDSPVKAKSGKKKKKKKKQKKRDVMQSFRRTSPIRTSAMEKSAEAFISSSHLIDNLNELGSIGLTMIKAELLTAAERLGSRLPPNTLDNLINEFGGPEFVAEMTGRRGRVVSREDGEIEYELRHAGADVPLELMNMDEKDKFMKGDKLIAIISEAASSGISLQSDRRALNHRRRVHITLELPWSADKAIQQFGRTHRSNQVNAPEYIFLISELSGEKRFASVVAKRLESLGALTHGDRRATETRDLSQFNLDNRYGRSALDIMLKTVIGGYDPPLTPPPKNYQPGDFFEDMRRYMEGVGLLSQYKGIYSIEKEYANIPKFLNRILGLPVHAQNAIFQYFSDIVTELVAQAKHDGTYDMGIMDLGMGSDEARKLETRVFLGRVDRGSFHVEIHKIGVERGISWEDAHATWKDHLDDEAGFYVTISGSAGKKGIVLIFGVGQKRESIALGRLCCTIRPNTGRSSKLETLEELKKRFQLFDLDQAEKIWRNQFEASNVMCQHKYLHNRCNHEISNGVYCETGRRTRTYFVLSGSVLSVWPIVEEVLSGGLSIRDMKRPPKMQIIRVLTQQDQKIVGLLILPQFVRSLVAKLEEHCGRSILEDNNTTASS